MADFPLLNEASLVMIPGATKEGKVYSQVPTDGSGDFTFTRSTSATRVNEAGNIEKGYENLLLQSNSFDTTWLNSNTTETSGQAGYDGTNDAWLLSKSAANGMVYQSISSSGVQTISIYAKKGTNSWMQIYAVGSSNVRAYYDLENGVLGAYSLNTIDRKIEDIGLGWYRCSVTFNSSLSSVRVFVSDGSNNDSGTSGSIYIQDAQLNQGLVAYPYLETTTAPVYGGLQADQPRLDYTDATCPSLLLEPSRTNLVGYSEYKASGNFTNSTPSYNAASSPEGLQNATEMFDNSTNGQHRVPIGSFSVTSGTDYTISAFVKNNDIGYCYLLLEGGFTQTRYYFNLSTGQPITSGLEVENFANGWYRIYVTQSAASSGTGSVFLNMSNNGVSPIYVGSNQSLYFYGFQAEQASYPTSYIPTYGSAESRGTDDLTSTPLSIDGLFGATSGSIFMEFTNPLKGLVNNWFYMTGQPVGGSDASMRVRGYWQMNIPGLTWNPTPNLGSLNNATKVAVKWGGGVAKLFIDGSEDAASTYTGGDINMNGTLRSLNGSFNFAKNNANFKQILFFDSALTDTECIALTTL